MSKIVNLVVFIDGTGNSSFKKPAKAKTNVALLKDACSTDICSAGNGADLEQRVYYKPGVGTRFWERWFGSTAGVWLEERVKESRSWLENEITIAHEDGIIPKVYIFGFSRGAYAARWLANDLGEEIEFLGVWDTVKTTLKGPDVEQASDLIKRACHAMAIDEHRKLFGVTHFYTSPRVSEVWFPSCHCDVGGGYENNPLSSSALNWIARHAATCGLVIDWDKIPDEPDFSKMPVIHDEAAKWYWRTLNFFAGDSYCNREILPSDIVYPTVDHLKMFDYAPDYLPMNCIVLNEQASQRYSNIV